jgi:hypothetical protein
VGSRRIWWKGANLVTMRGCAVALGLLAFGTSACGSSEASDAGSGGGSGPGGGTAGSAGALAGSAGASGSSAGGTGGSSSATGGSSGAPAGDCAAPFTSSRLLYTAVTVPTSLSITDDELELYYTNQFIWVQRRAARTDPFGAASEVTELSPVCSGATATGSVDVTGDGLRLYFTCGETVGPIQLATRADRSAPFTLDPNPVGTAETSISVSSDELTLFSVINNGENAQALIHTRATTSEPFGPGSPIPGINQPFRFPELSADGSTLFGSIAPTPRLWRLARATRDPATGSFSTPTADGLPAPPNVPDDAYIQGDYTPTVGGGCRAVYFTRSVVPEFTWTVEVAER